MSHERHETAANVIDDALDAWRLLVKAGGWTKLKKDFGVIGFQRTTEITHSRFNGFHPHHHVAVLTETVLTDTQRQAFRDRLDRLWSTQITKLQRKVHPDLGLTVEPIRNDEGVGAYVSKIEMELVRSDLKTGRGKHSRSHWQIAVDAAELKDPQDIALWRDLFHALQRRQYMSTSKGFWKLYGVVEARTDEEIAEEQLDATPFVELDRNIYTTAAKNSRPVLSEIRALAEAGATPAVLAAVLGRRLGQNLEVLDLGPGQVPVIRATPTTNERNRT